MRSSSCEDLLEKSHIPIYRYLITGSRRPALSRPATVTLEEVRAAIETLKAQGVPDPGVHRIRALIGHGSVTTINKLKHQIRAEELNRVLPGTNRRMPDPITDAAARLWEDLNAEIDKIDQQREAEAREELAKLEARHAQTISEKEDLAARLVKVEEALTEAQTQIAHLTEERDQVTAQRDAGRQDNRVLKEQVAAAKNERDHAIEQMATLSQRAAEREKELERQIDTIHNERLQERARAEAEHERLEEDVRRWRGMFLEIQQDMKRQLEARETDLHESQQRIKTLEGELRELRTALEAVRTENAEHREHRARLEQALADAASRLQEIPTLQQRVEQLAQERDSFDASLRQCREELAANRAALAHKSTRKKKT
ncbi:MAG: DNA-binding protein [Alphaproteobacteria bacterium]|nr:MAG: DNA-binding protein [Alphaproteobacteria bacterium]